MSKYKYKFSFKIKNITSTIIVSAHGAEKFLVIYYIKSNWINVSSIDNIVSLLLITKLPFSFAFIIDQQSQFLYI